MNARALILLSIASLLGEAAMAEDEVRFGRLFMEPKTREQLDESRRQNSESRPLPQIKPEDAEITLLKIDGVILRHNGEAEVWVNGQRSESSQPPVRPAGANRFRVALPGGGEVTLKPGQVYSFESRRILEGYEAARELEAERKPAEEAAQPAATETPAAAPSATASPADPPGVAPAQGFDEATLADQDMRIRLQQESAQPDGAANTQSP